MDEFLTLGADPHDAAEAGMEEGFSRCRGAVN
jgi:hypothetical protein